MKKVVSCIIVMTMLTGCGLFKPPTIVNNTYPTVVIQSQPQIWNAVSAIAGTVWIWFQVVSASKFNSILPFTKIHLWENRYMYAGAGTVAAGYLIAKYIKGKQETEDGKNGKAGSESFTESGTSKPETGSDTNGVESPKEPASR